MCCQTGSWVIRILAVVAMQSELKSTTNLGVLLPVGLGNTLMDFMLADRHYTEPLCSVFLGFVNVVSASTQTYCPQEGATWTPKVRKTKAQKF